MPPARPLITLLTDFGTKDHFVASMKGVILTINPDAHIIDISHDIGPHQIAEAAYCLRACYRTFPEGTVHVAVVDPGVGSSRRPILVKTARYYFVAPDNGVLTLALNEEQGVEIRQLENRQYQLDSVGATFHGRDVFAPAAAWLTKRRPMDSFGGVIGSPVCLPLEEPVWDGGALVGTITIVDRFGNLLSNVTSQALEVARSRKGQNDLSISIGGVRIEKLVASYSEGSPDRLCALINSNDQVEVFVKEKSAAGMFGVGAGDVLRID